MNLINSLVCLFLFVALSQCATNVQCPTTAITVPTRLIASDATFVISVPFTTDNSAVSLSYSFPLHGSITASSTTNGVVSFTFSAEVGYTGASSFTFNLDTTPLCTISLNIACVPKTCETSGVCGTIEPGCGLPSLLCDSCGEGMMCSEDDICVCKPITNCPTQNRTCGQLFDGCVNIFCGVCSGTDYCGPNGMCVPCAADCDYYEPGPDDDDDNNNEDESDYCFDWTDCSFNGQCGRSGNCKCFPKYAGDECEKCAHGLFNYPDCTTTQLNGQSCSDATTCASGLCVDGVCCDSTCDGQCEACNIPGNSGVCTPVTGQPVSGRGECTTDGSTCGGYCDGVDTTTCTYPSSTTVCQAASCYNGQIGSEITCNSKGVCASPGRSSCSGYNCYVSDSAEGVCLSTCAASTDCVTGYYCDASATKCVVSLTIGSTCTENAMCLSGNCDSGICAVAATQGVPVITHVSTAPTLGGWVVIVGSLFGKVASNIAVTFGEHGVCSDVHVIVADLMINCSVSYGTGTKPLIVTVSGIQSEPSAFSRDVPVITSVNVQNTSLVILGSNFGQAVTTLSVQLNGIECIVGTVEDSSITLFPDFTAVLLAATSGKTINVVVTVDGLVASTSFAYDGSSTATTGVVKTVSASYQLSPLMIFNILVLLCFMLTQM